MPDPNDILREELLKRLDVLIHEEATQSDTGFGAPKHPCAGVKTVALDLLAANHAKDEEIEKLKEQLNLATMHREEESEVTIEQLATVTQERDALKAVVESRKADPQDGYCRDCGRRWQTVDAMEICPKCIVESENRAVAELDARTQEAAQAQARVKVLEDLARQEQRRKEGE